MPSGIAVRTGQLPTNFQAGAAVFQLFPSLGNGAGEDDHVVVAFTDAAVDHGFRETTVFKCDAHGSSHRWGGLDDAEALAPNQRIVGRHDVEAALANLGGSGYLEVESHELARLRDTGTRLACSWAVGHLAMSAEAASGYAKENWGLFAARHLVEHEGREKPFRSTNMVFGLSQLQTMSAIGPREAGQGLLALARE